MVPGISTLLMALAVLDALRWPDAIWEAAGRHKWRWVVAMIALPGLGAALYRRRVVPDLARFGQRMDLAQLTNVVTPSGRPAIATSGRG